MSNTRVGGIAIARALSRYWLRRHRPALLVLAAVAVVALVLAFGGQRSRAETLYGQILFFTPVAAGLLSMGGIVSDERQSGLIVMWFQKRGSLFRTYVVRYAIAQGMLFVVSSLFAVCAVTIAVASGVIAPERGLRIAAVLWVFALLPGAMVFAFSACGVKRDALLTLLLILGSIAALAATGLDNSAGAHAVRIIAFPLDAVSTLIGSTAAMSWQTALLTVLAQCAGWTAFGLAGLRYTAYALTRGR
jgi:hypothetical protein